MNAKDYLSLVYLDDHVFSKDDTIKLMEEYYKYRIEYDNQTKSNEFTYYLCSKSLVDIIKPMNYSNPFKSGYLNDYEEYYVALLNYDTCCYIYNNLPEKEKDKFYISQLVPGTMDITGLTLKGMRKNGIFFEIELVTGLTTFSNVAMVLHNLSEDFNITPIALINKIINKKLN